MATFSEMMKAARSRHQDGDPKREGKRFREILSILRKHDLKDGVSPEAAVELLQDLGPTFVKLGQIASTHPDVLPMEYCKALGRFGRTPPPSGWTRYIDAVSLRQNLRDQRPCRGPGLPAQRYCKAAI